MNVTIIFNKPYLIGGRFMLNDPIVHEYLMEITENNENSFPIIECIMKGTTIDLEISEETEIKLTTVRKILYKLHDAGIATCKKAKY